MVARGFYALSDLRTPLKTSLLGMGINVTLDLVLVWPLGECGLALATAISASVQVVLMVKLFSRLHGPLDWRLLLRAHAKTMCAASLMGIAMFGFSSELPGTDGRWHELLQVGGSLLAGGGVFLLTAWLLRCEELTLLWPAIATRAERAVHTQTAVDLLH